MQTYRHRGRRRSASVGLVFPIAVIGAALALLTTTASAQQARVRTANSYGMAGCGLGSMLFGDEPGFIQVLAGTTNAATGTQSFGITTGTSNCTDSSEPVVQVSAFVETNRTALVKDMARGGGETVSTLASLAGCRDVAAVGRTLQRNFDRVFSSAAVTDRQVSTRVIAELERDPQLGCTKLGALPPAKPGLVRANRSARL
jgi:hypothetical protein